MCLCSLSWGALGPVPRSRAHRELTEAGISWLLSLLFSHWSQAVFLKYIIAVCILRPAVVFKIRASVTMSENTTYQLCRSAPGYSTFLLCAVVLLTKHQVFQGTTSDSYGITLGPILLFSH